MEEQLMIIMEHQEAMRLLCELNDGDCALLYAHLFTIGGRSDLVSLRKQMAVDERRVARARDLLLLKKICKVPGSMPVAEVEKYPTAKLLEAKKGDSSFRGICDYYEMAAGHGIRESEINALYAVYDKLNMPSDVMMLLINYCRTRTRLSAREIEKVGYEWHDKGVMTYTAAADLVDNITQRSGKVARVMRLFGVTDRRASESEERYISSWLDMGMSEQMLRIAYDRTVLQTGKLQWKYMNRIIEDWNKKGYKNVRQVELGEATSFRTSQRAQGEAEVSVAAAVTAMFERKRQERETKQAGRLEAVRKKSPEFAGNEIAIGQLTVKKAKLSLSNDQAGLAALEREQAELLTARGEILRRLGITEGDLVLKPECPKCNDYGYVGSQMCTCFEQACIDEERRRKA